MADYRIIDADGHVMELDSELREFIGAPYKDLEWHQSYSFWPGLTMDGYLRSLRQKGGWAGGGDGPKANHWLEFLDKNKIELTVLYPTQGLTHAAIQDKDWAICMARAYNDWLYHKFMKASPRLIGVALLPIQDVSEAVKELRRAVNELGMVGAVLPAVAPGGVVEHEGVRAGQQRPDDPLVELGHRFEQRVDAGGEQRRRLGLGTALQAVHARGVILAVCPTDQPVDGVRRQQHRLPRVDRLYRALDPHRPSKTRSLPARSGLTLTPS